jgi:Holliday junction resolvasome RuvABC ATP-dependent DNA helicase subunit
MPLWALIDDYCFGIFIGLGVDTTLIALLMQRFVYIVAIWVLGFMFGMLRRKLIT